MLAKRIRQFGAAIRDPIGHFTLHKIVDRAGTLGIAAQIGQLSWKYVGVYFDTRLDARARRALIVDHYRWMMTRFPHSPLARDLQAGMEVWRSTDDAGIDYTVIMRSATICPMEGEVELVFQDSEGRLAFLTFLFGGDLLASGPVLSIGGFQGGYGRRQDCRRAAKSNGEVTPMNILFIAAKALAQAINAEALLGMCDEGQIARPYAEDKMYLNYNQTWTDLGGERTPSGYFALDFGPQPARSLDHLSSAHRARARRKSAFKAEMQDRMRARFAELLQPDTERFGQRIAD